MTLEIVVKDRDILFNDMLGTARVDVRSICGNTGGSGQDVRVLRLEGAGGHKASSLKGAGEIKLVLSLQFPQHQQGTY
jgi:hypothetical protein